MLSILSLNKNYQKVIFISYDKNIHYFTQTMNFKYIFRIFFNIFITEKVTVIKNSS